MSLSRFSAESIKLGPAAFDAPEVLTRLLAQEKASQGFLVEKSDAEQDKVFIGVAPFETLRVRGGKIIQETSKGRKILAGNPFAVLGQRLADFRVEGSAKPFTTGAVGTMDYEMVRHIERLPKRPPTEEGLLMFFDAILVWDRRKGDAELVGLLPKNGRAANREALRRKAERISAILRSCPPRFEKRLKIPKKQAALQGALGRPAFLRGVQKIKEHIRAGDIFQCVLSERFTAQVSAKPIEVYRHLRRISPAPYPFFIKDGDQYLIGASPERLVRVVDGLALNCPIAGTRLRGKTPAEDRKFERALLKSPKERAEHLMLVDLARNDLGRICEPGSVKVTKLMELRRFSNVMHLVSDVEGKLEHGRTGWEALAASFPAGTVSGAPKVRAMEIISGLEPVPRGYYAGTVFQHDFSGNLDSALTIRTLHLSKGRVWLRAGAGIVADSDPAREYQEVLNKLAGLRKTLALAAA